MEKPARGDVDFLFDPVVSRETASTRTDACSVSAQTETVVSGAEMSVDAQEQVCAPRPFRNGILPRDDH